MEYCVKYHWQMTFILTDGKLIKLGKEEGPNNQSKEK